MDEVAALHREKEVFSQPGKAETDAVDHAGFRHLYQRLHRGEINHLERERERER